MNQFKDLDIKSEVKSFIGKKVSMAQVLNREITVHDYTIEKSKFPKENNDKCIYLQIGIKENMHILFSSSMGLLNQLKQISKDKFPFTTTIIEQEDKRLQFT